MSCASNSEHHLGNADIFNTLVTSYSATHQIVKLVSIQLNQQNFTKNTGSFPHTGS